MNNNIGSTTDLVRNLLAWAVFALVLSTLWLLKPNVNVYERAMYLPLVDNRDAIANNQVSILNRSNSFLYKKVGYITVFLPYPTDDTAVQKKAVEQAKMMAANAGADKLLVEDMRPAVWFDSGLRLLRLQAVAMAQS